MMRSTTVGEHQQWSLVKNIAILFVWVFFWEALLMLIQERFAIPPRITWWLDPLILGALMVPVIFSRFYRPFTDQIRSMEQTTGHLGRLQKDLEEVNQRQTEVIEQATRQLQTELREKAMAEESNRRHYEFQRVINHLLERSQEHTSLDAILQTALDSILSLKWLKIEAKGCLFLTHQGGQELVLRVSRDLSPQVLEVCGRLPFGRCVCGKTAERKAVQFCKSDMPDHDMTYPGMAPHAHYCLPIQFGEELLGVLNLYIEKNHPYDDAEVQYLQAFTHVIAGIVKRHQATETIRRLNHALEQSPVLFVITDPMGNIEYVNQRFLEVTGYHLNEVLGRNCRFLKSDETPPEIYRDLWETIKAGKNWRGIFHNRKKNGDLYWDRSLISPVKNEAGEVINFIGIKEDITTLKAFEFEKAELERQLQMALKLEALGTLAGGVAHDFNNILGSIMGYAELVYSDDCGAELRSNLEEILQATRRGQELTGKILRFSRLGNAKREPVKIPMMVEEVLGLITIKIPDTIRVLKEYSSPDDTVFGFPIEIHRLIMNLSLNAVYAMTARGGVLRFRTSHQVLDAPRIIRKIKVGPGDYLVFEIGDTGEGIPEEILPKLFTPFFTTKPEGIGTGMGLSMAWKTVVDCGGAIEVESSPERGTIFRLFFPANQASQG